MPLGIVYVSFKTSPPAAGSATRATDRMRGPHVERPLLGRFRKANGCLPRSDARSHAHGDQDAQKCGRVPTSGGGERDWAVPLAPHPCPVSPSPEMIRFEARARRRDESWDGSSVPPAAGAHNHKFAPPIGNVERRTASLSRGRRRPARGRSRPRRRGRRRRASASCRGSRAGCRSRRSRGSCRA